MPDDEVRYRGYVIHPTQLPSGDWQAHFHREEFPSQVEWSLVGAGPTREDAIEDAKENIEALLQ